MNYRFGLSFFLSSVAVISLAPAHSYIQQWRLPSFHDQAGIAVTLFWRKEVILFFIY
jgi:hypothetical protein